MFGFRFKLTEQTSFWKVTFLASARPGHIKVYHGLSVCACVLFLSSYLRHRPYILLRAYHYLIKSLYITMMSYHRNGRYWNRFRDLVTNLVLNVGQIQAVLRLANDSLVTHIRCALSSRRKAALKARHKIYDTIKLPLTKMR